MQTQNDTDQATKTPSATLQPVPEPTSAPASLLPVTTTAEIPGSSQLPAPPSLSVADGVAAAPSSDLQTPAPAAPLTGSAAPPSVGVLGQVETLSDAEQAEFQLHETTVAKGGEARVDSGLALGLIRDKRLYRAEFDSFESYCRARWQYGRNYVNRLIAASQLFTHLVTICHLNRPLCEGQIRPLIGLAPEQAQLAWECAVQLAGGRKITQRIVKTAVNELGLGAQNSDSEAQPRQSKAEQRRLIEESIGQLLALVAQRAAYEALMEKLESLHGLVRSLFAASRRKAVTGSPT